MSRPIARDGKEDVDSEEPSQAADSEGDGYSADEFVTTPNQHQQASSKYTPATGVEAE